MTNLQKFTLGILFTCFTVIMSGCSSSSSSSSSSGGPAIETSPSVNFDFGTITEGNIASPLRVLITNTGSERLDISSISLSDNLNFNLSTVGCGTASPALSAGESCTIEVTFNPTQFNTLPTNIATALEITSNAPSKILAITGTSEQVSSTLNITINQVETASCNAVAYVSVTDQSNFPVEGLSATDFTITETIASVDNVLGSPTSTTVGAAVEPISIAIVMDNSSSMTDIDIAEMNKAAIEVVAQLNATDLAEIIKFDLTVNVIQAFTNDKNLLTDAINAPFDGSGTSLYDAVQQAILDTKSQTTERKAIILITDGTDTSSATATLNEIISAASADSIPIFVIALGNFDQNTIDSVLKPIANDTSGEFYEADVAQNFSTIIEQKLTEILFVDQYILSYLSASAGNATDVNLTIGIDVDNLGTTTGTASKLVTSCPP